MGFIQAVNNFLDTHMPGRIVLDLKNAYGIVLINQLNCCKYPYFNFDNLHVGVPSASLQIDIQPYIDPSHL